MNKQREEIEDILGTLYGAIMKYFDFGANFIVDRFRVAINISSLVDGFIGVDE